VEHERRSSPRRAGTQHYSPPRGRAAARAARAAMSPRPCLPEPSRGHGLVSTRLPLQRPNPQMELKSRTASEPPKRVECSLSVARSDAFWEVWPGQFARSGNCSRQTNIELQSCTGCSLERNAATHSNTNVTATTTTTHHAVNACQWATMAKIDSINDV